MTTRPPSELDELSERQREVLRLIAAGRTNPEIAAAMGISLDGAKWHVREILSKLGVASREEAAAVWLREQRPAARAHRALAAMLPASRRAWMAVGASVVAVVAVGVLTTVLALRGGGDTPPAATPETSPSAAATATATVDAGGKPTPGTPGPTPTTIAGAIELRAGDAVPFPRDVVLYAVDAAWEGPSAAFRRYYVDAQGELRTDTLLETVAPAGAPESEVRAIVGVVAGPNGSFVAALCHGTCYGAPQPVTVVRSTDGGITWTELGTLEAEGWVGPIAATRTGALLLRSYENPPTIVSLPDDGTSFEVPAELRDTQLFSWIDGTGAVGIGGLTMDGRVVDARTGATLATLPADGTTRFPDRVTVRGGVAELTVQWWIDRGEAPRSGYLAFLPMGASSFRAMYHWAHERGLDWITRVEWLSSTVALARTSFEGERYVAEMVPDFYGSVPALVDFETGEVAPLAPFVAQLASKAGGPVPISVAAGPFARVMTPGDCLNVREAADPGAAPLTCAADGALLPLRENADVTAGGETWVAVTMPDGRPGWAAASYLEVERGE